jgi:hypothetical protein
MITIEAAKFIPYPGAVPCSRFRTPTRRAPHRAAVGRFGLETAFPRSTAKEKYLRRVWRRGDGARWGGGEIPPSRVAGAGITESGVAASPQFCPKYSVSDWCEFLYMKASANLNPKYLYITNEIPAFKSSASPDMKTSASVLRVAKQNTLSKNKIPELRPE